MKRTVLSLCMMAVISTIAYAQSFVDTFDANSLGWTECAFESNKGSAIIDKGVLTIKSKGENKAAGAILTAMSGVATKVGENTFFETHCYAPLDVKKPFEVIANVKVDKLANDRVCGFVFNYKDGGNFYCFTFNDEMVNFTRYVDNRVVGSISQGIKWSSKKKLEQVWKLVCDGDVLSFYVDDMEILKVRYMPLDFSGIGFYTFGKQTLVVDEMTFTQN
ncbi:MAG: hypothetical protein K2M19_07485 [Muribaculaceae bacterium]|nr:hypothetical protein [Muribaculaceae bacterium]